MEHNLREHNSTSIRGLALMYDYRKEHGLLGMYV